MFVEDLPGEENEHTVLFEFKYDYEADYTKAVDLSKTFFLELGEDEAYARDLDAITNVFTHLYSHLSKPDRFFTQRQIVESQDINGKM